MKRRKRWKKKVTKDKRRKAIISGSSDKQDPLSAPHILALYSQIGKQIDSLEWSLCQALWSYRWLHMIYMIR